MPNTTWGSEERRCRGSAEIPEVLEAEGYGQSGLRVDVDVLSQPPPPRPRPTTTTTGWGKSFGERRSLRVLVPHGCFATSRSPALRHLWPQRRGV